VPYPRERNTTPSFSSSSIALRTVIREIFSDWLNSRSPGRISSCTRVPSRTASLIVLAKRLYSGVRLSCASVAVSRENSAS